LSAAAPYSGDTSCARLTRDDSTKEQGMKTLATIMITTILAAATPAHALTKADLFGHGLRTAKAARTVVIDASTRYVNVKQGDILKLCDGGHCVTWLFDGVRETVPLAEIMPEGRHVTVYVDIPPLG
jgi:hypothetical protein